LTQQIKTIVLRAEMAEEQASKLKTELDQAFTKILTDKSKINEQITAIGALTRQIEALRALREDLEIRVKDMLARVADRDEKLITEKSISESARAQVALLNQQIRILRQQIAKIATSLDASEAAAQKQRIRIANLGKRLNAALAGKVQELARYRSEFFGRLREILGNQPGIRIVGDRFVFQSEVLFTKGSAELGPDGQAQIGRLAGTLRAISRKIPAKIEWILRVDGHTDKIPIATARFPSNWELSTARSISVVKFLIDAGIPSKNLAATGFGQFQPIDPRDDEIAYRRNRRIELKLTQR
jgi:chemotaxis protein MotB